MDLDDETRKIAERQVDAFIKVLAVRYGLKEEEMPEIVDNLRWVSKKRQVIEKASLYAMLTIIGVVVVAALTTLWEGFKRKIGGG